MKKLMLSIFVLASLTSQARSDDYTRADVLDAKDAAAGYCNQYNETALRAIYKNLSERLTKIRSLQAECSYLYKRAAILGQEDASAGAAAVDKFDECSANLQKMQREQSSLASAINEASRFQNADTYVAFHTRRDSAEACAASYQQTQTLKSLLNL